MFPLVRGGRFAEMLGKGRSAALALYDKLQADDRFLPAFPPELDIVVWAVKASSVSESSELARKIFAAAARRGLHLALADMPEQFFDLDSAKIARDRDTITCLRSVLMKPEPLDWIDRIWDRLDEAASEG